MQTAQHGPHAPRRAGGRGTSLGTIIMDPTRPRSTRVCLAMSLLAAACMCRVVWSSLPMGYVASTWQIRLLNLDCHALGQGCAHPCAQIMSMHHDNRGLYDKHGRLFFKYGGFFTREGDAYLPPSTTSMTAFGCAHAAQAKPSDMTLYDNSHLHDGRCTPWSP